MTVPREWSMEQSVSFDSSTTALPRNQQEAEPLHSVQHRSEVYSSPRKITLMPRNPHVDLPPLQACQAQADDASRCPAQTAPGPPGGGGDPHELATMPVLTENGIIQTAVIPVEDGYAIPVIKYGSGFAVPALSVKSEVVFLSNEEVGARPWWRRFRAQGDSDASTTDPASDSGDRETHVDDHFSNDHSDSGSAPVTAGTSEAALTKLLPKELAVLQWLQRMYREKKMHEVPLEPKKSKLPPRRETPKDPDLAACQELMEWLIKVTRERGYTEENEFADLDVKAFASALKKPKVMAEVARIMRDLQYPGGTHRQFDLNRQAPFDTSVMDSKEMDESKPSQGSRSSSSTEAYERYYSRRPSALQAKSPTPEPPLAMPTSAKYLERTGRPPSLPGWSLRFYKPEALPRVSVPRHVKVEPMDAVQVAIRPPRALNQTQKRFRATRQKRRQPELPALEVNADGTFDFPSVRRLLASWEDFEPQVPVRKRLTQEWKPSLPEECVQRSNSHGADAHSRSGSRSGSRSNSRNDTPRDAEMKVEDVRSGVDSSMCSPLRMRLNSICDEAKSQTLVGGESCRPCNSPTNSPYGRASEAADEAGDDSDPFCMAVTVD